MRRGPMIFAGILGVAVVFAEQFMEGRAEVRERAPVAIPGTVDIPADRVNFGFDRLTLQEYVEEMQHLGAFPALAKHDGQLVERVGIFL